MSTATNRRKRRIRKFCHRNRKQLLILECLVFALLLLAAVKVIRGDRSSGNAASGTELAATTGISAVENGTESGTEAGTEAEATSEETLVEPEFSPHTVDATKPSNMIDHTEVEVDGEILTDSFTGFEQGEISFDLPQRYTDLEGVITFRGNNFRNGGAYGTVEFTDDELESLWVKNTGSLTYDGRSWTGSGWTGQPLIVKWPEAVRKSMNLYDSAKNKEDLVEVIYACMDGNIYFLDLETGEQTRDTMKLGYTFKGAGALDPRGYPIMYVGSGYDSANGKSRVFVINLIDCSVMYEFGNGDSFSQRGNLSYFDSSPLVDAETDTLIYPGENGILYLIHLNTVYDPEAGTLTIDPETVKWRYYGKRTSLYNYWLGMEDSAAVYKGYLYIADNGGHMMCLNLNTLELVWVQDILDDSNGSPVLSIEDGKVYVYISTSFHKGWRASDSAEIPIWKLDAETGEIIWQTSYTCKSEDGVSGGVQSTIAVGQKDLSDYIYVTVSKVGNLYNGLLSCINKETGEICWEHESAYAWSSPVCVYNAAGEGRVIYATSGDDIFMLNGESGAVEKELDLEDGTVEATPAVYGSTMVLGSRGCTIRGISIGAERTAQ